MSAGLILPVTAAAATAAAQRVRRAGALLVLLAGAATVAGAGGGADAEPAAAPAPAAASASAVRIGSRGQEFPPAPPVPAGPLDEALARDIQTLIEALQRRVVDRESIASIGQSGDPRAGWLLVDLMRFSSMERLNAIVAAFQTLTGSESELPRGELNELADRLIAWDTPAPPGYREMKQQIFALIDPRWAPFFADRAASIDWRLVAWGGVLMDDRVDASPGKHCNRCIPALDDPPVTSAADGSWYADEGLVFGLVVGGEARAYPRHIMEVHEMVNDTLGGRRIGMPYCTLCGSAQAYYTDNVEGFAPVLRTSGLLVRSNKLMFDISTMSAIDTFSGRALSGPLHEQAVVLEQLSVVTSTWGAWKEAHPHTTIVAEDGGIPGNVYPLDPLRGRDDNGPIFPVGDVDPRLPVQERVLGVEAPGEQPVAFPVANAVLALRDGEVVQLAGVRLQLDGSGLRAFIGDRDAVGHEAFWFAWSQFRPGSLVWQRS